MIGTVDSKEVLGGLDKSSVEEVEQRCGQYTIVTLLESVL